MCADVDSDTDADKGVLGDPSNSSDSVRAVEVAKWISIAAGTEVVDQRWLGERASKEEAQASPEKNGEHGNGLDCGK